MRGHCLCGAVQITVTGSPGEVSACHCDMCRRWTGAAQWGFEVPADAVTVRGDVGRYRASSFAERAFCPTCGTHLWLRDDDGPYEFVPGLFDGARDLPLAREVYADRAFACVPLAGEHPRVSREAYERDHPHVNMEVRHDQV
ncbi:GFA family protein [Psychromarinibacter sp. C21-152]|uniref:GFA family protein n=1 Tax=Psychromarinibacter sediminicola TaxID=3033385 RepID=A0AAE3NUE5_9RHOB|nr:GFA family protein [Psychromarinibacter sediminicola]MDF0601155.1 GFA family protein [Psychromarinibacter sediminicola]